MAYDDRYGDDSNRWGGSNERGQRDQERGQQRDRFDRDPGAHADYYRGGDFGRSRMGPEGGFEERDQFRRSDRHAEQGQSWGRGDQGQRQSQHHDPDYASWRDRQIDAFDRDYDEYRRENASRFESEFGAWRETRGQQRQSMGRVAEHMEVVGSDGQHVGTVDKVRDGRIVLTKSDPSAGGHHHSIPCGWLQSVDDKVTLNKSAEQAMQAWRDEETSRALFEPRDRGSDGPHILERSFSGTYRDER